MYIYIQVLYLPNSETKNEIDNTINKIEKNDKGWPCFVGPEFCDAGQ